MKVAFSFIFSRKSLFEIKCLPCCPFSLWAYSSVKCHCDCRLGLFNLLIDDWIKFQTYDNDLDPIEANRQFIRVYNAIPDRDVSSGGGMFYASFLRRNLISVRRYGFCSIRWWMCGWLYFDS